MRHLARLSLAAALLALAPAAQAQTPCEQGAWEAPFDHDMRGFRVPPMEHRFAAVHMSLIPIGPHRGSVLVWDHQGNQMATAWTQRWSVIDVSLPGRPRFRNFELLLPPDAGDLFCSAHAWTRRGDLLVVGGTLLYPGDGHHGPSPGFLGGRMVYLYQPDVGVCGRWVRQPNLEVGRWYPSATVLGTDQVLVSGGTSDTTGASHNDYEVFDPAAGTWQDNGGSHLFAGPPSPFDLYPRLHLLSTGDVFLSGQTGFASRMNHLVAPGIWTSTDAMSVEYRLFGSHVLLPRSASGDDRVMAIGGEGYVGGQPLGPLDAVEVCWAAGAQAPEWDWAAWAPLAQARMHINAVLLPDASVLVIGGRTDTWTIPFGLYTRTPERFVPATGQWQAMADAASYRDYHSTAMLLPDGRVLTAGGEARTWDYQVYRPPYLACGLPRPEIVSAPVAMTYDSIDPRGYVVQHRPMQDDAVDHGVLMRPGSVTHHSDFDQRCVELETSMRSPTSITVHAPRDSNAAPRGHYMLFLVSRRGVPSVASWVHLE